MRAAEALGRRREKPGLKKPAVGASSGVGGRGRPGGGGGCWGGGGGGSGRVWWW